MRVPGVAALSRFGQGRALPQRTLLHSVAMMALVMLLVASGAGVTFALWTSQATAGGTAGGAQLNVTTNFAGADTIFANHVPTATGSFTFSNTTDTASTTAGAFSVVLGATGDSQLASALALTVWPQTAAPCTIAATPSGVVATGTWASIPAITGTLVAGSSRTYCVRMTSAERSNLATVDGELLINPSVTATLSVGNWADTASATTVQKTAYIFPAWSPTANTWYQITNLGTGKCVDVYSASVNNSTGVIDYPCKTGNAAGDYNQHWKFTATSIGYYDLTPRHAQALRMDVVGASLNSLAAIDVQSDAASRVSQEWQLQRKSDNVYQLVSRLSGLCLQPNDTAVYGDVEYAQTVCNGAANQSFSLAQKSVDVPTMTIACAPAAGNGVTYSWTGAAIDAYEFQARQGASAFTTVKTAPLGSTSVTILPADLAALTADGQYNVQSLWNSNVLASSNLWKTTTAGTTSLTCSAPLPPLNTLTCTASAPRSVVIAWGHAAAGTYTVQQLSFGTWSTIGTATAGATSFTVTATNPAWSDGVRDIRVTYGAASAAIQVYKLGNVNNEYLWCLPTPTVQVTCKQGSGGNDVTLLWSTLSAYTPSTATVTYGGTTWANRTVTHSSGFSSFTVRDNEVSSITAGTYTVSLALMAGSFTQANVGTTNLRVANGNGKDIYCAP